MGIWDALKKKIANDGENHHSEMQDQIGKNVYEIASFDINNASLVEKINYFLNNRSQGEQIQLADKLLREGPYESSIEMYEALIQKYPEERDRYENGIGSAYLKLKDFPAAIEYYKKARVHGMHPDITDKNIWDACLKQYKNTDDISFIQKYFEHSEINKYAHLANDILKGAGRETVEAPLIAPQAPIEQPIDKNKIEEDSSIESHPLDNIIAENQNSEDVAKKDKNSDENQFSLFGFGSERPSNLGVPDEPVQEGENDSEMYTPGDNYAPEEQEIPDENAPNILMALDYHIGKFFKNEDIIVWKDKRTDDYRIDVYHIKPNEERNYHILISYGMSRKPMNVPDGAEQFKYGELAIILPEEWDMSEEGLKDPNNYWPVLWLKNLARIPAQHQSWLCYGHSIPHGNPSQPIADTEFEGVVIMDSVTLPEEFQEMKLGDESLYIYTIVPVYPEEMEYKIKNDMESLRNAFIEAKIPDFVWVDRPTAVSDQMI